MYSFMNSETLYRAIEEIREEKGLSIYAMTKRAGISCATVYKWRDRKSTPSLYIIERICYALNTDISLLFLRCERLINKETIKTCITNCSSSDNNDLVEDEDGQKRLISLWDSLDTRQRAVVLNLIEQIVLSQKQ